MRAYRLYLIYNAHLTHFELKKKHGGVLAFTRVKSLHFVREKNMLKWFIAVMIPLVIISMIAVSYLFSYYE